ncbi:hypothetical protein [Phycicoccus sp.]|uniref:hypothetical protein n=1 Tax=Phycicoccus sp. TaxID=1902410 RepID=UPI002CB3D9E9|nr:hypothetical protein [Phycicoccus sp.]HMM95341.1 hypothetical protein [Phycicoccus sp.]
MKKLLIVAAMGTLALTGCGGAAKTGEFAAPAPTVTVTATPKAETRDVEVVPQVCLDALDAGEKVSGAGGKGLTSAANVLGEIPNLIDAILAGDVDEIDRITAVAEKETTKLNSLGMDDLVSAYNEKADACRATAKGSA